MDGELENKIETFFKNDFEIQRILAESYLNQSYLKKDYGQKAEKLFNKLILVSFKRSHK